MPSAGGLWVRRTDPDALARLVGATPEQAARLRDRILAQGPALTGRRPSHA